MSEAQQVKGKDHGGLHRLKHRKNLMAKQIGDISRAYQGKFMPSHVMSALKVLKDETRAIHLADNYMRGRVYSQVERDPHTGPFWERVEALVRRAGGPVVVMPPIAEWRRSNAA